jgi:hypothetical protein
MRFIPTWLHGILDYPMSLLLIALPWLADFGNDYATWISVSAGVAMLGLSALTAYEAGLIRVVPMAAHLMVDGVMGAALAASPWLFDFANEVWLPFVVLGAGEIAAALTTHTQPSTRLARSAI